MTSAHFISKVFAELKIERKNKELQNWDGFIAEMKKFNKCTKMNFEGKRENIFDVENVLPRVVKLFADLRVLVECRVLEGEDSLIFMFLLSGETLA